MLRLLQVAVLAGFTTLSATPAQAQIAVKFFGTAQAGQLSPAIAAAVDGSGVDVSGFLCFEAPLVDLTTGHAAGIGVDCLNVFDGAGDSAGDGLQLEAKTFFFLPQGLLVNHGCTSVRPMFAGVGDAGVTHITGSVGPGELGGALHPIPQCAGAGGLVLATGGFKNFTGETRLSGAVNLSRAGEGIITFSCIFTITLDRPGRGRP